jgi:hypothetical protein
MSLPVHRRHHVAGLDYVFVGRGTVVVRTDRDQLLPGTFRNLLLNVERDLVERGLTIIQGAYYLPHVQVMPNPLDLAGAAISFVHRHPEMRAVCLVAPLNGLFAVAMETIARALPNFTVRFLRDPAEALAVLRPREPDLPAAWHELPAGVHA